jgi:drug/metabolite transporter (DMT)-like permease
MGAESGKAGFLTATYILMVPILGIFLKRKCGAKIWIGVFIALIGMYFLCMNGTFSLSGSDLLLLAGALCFAIQILVIDHFVSQVDAVRLSCIEFFVTGLGTCIVMIFTDMGPSAGGIAQWAQSLCTWDAWIPILYAGIFSSGVGYTLQIVGQKGLNPAVASVAMSLESVVSVIAGWILLGQMLGGREIFGCVLMFIAIIIAQLPDREYTK